MKKNNVNKQTTQRNKHNFNRFFQDFRITNCAPASLKLHVYIRTKIM
jgi:hypothetical protein